MQTTQQDKPMPAHTLLTHPIIWLMAFLLSSLLIAGCEKAPTNHAEKAMSERVETIETPKLNITHHQDYLAALEKVTSAQAKLIYEMNRIQTGEVAHYDFLQYEHIELIRHAKALAHPPAALPESIRVDLTHQAQTLLDSANQLEWVIADFLRAHALVLSARYNLNDLIQQKATETDIEQLNHLFALNRHLNRHLNRYLIQQASEADLRDFMDEMKHQKNLQADALLFQLEQLINETPRAQTAVKQLINAPINNQAWLLAHTYNLALPKN